MSDQTFATTSGNNFKKRPYDESISGSNATSSNFVPIFGGANQNVPFLFRAAPQTPQTQPWSPPPNFSAEGTFSIPTTHHQGSNDNADPLGNAQISRTGRPVALGGLRRILGQRQKALLGRRKRTAEGEFDDESGDSGANATTKSTTTSSSNHFTVNLPPVIQHRPDLSSALRGYLQFGFGFCLRAMVLYLAARFIVALQQDVDERISESSLEINQEIAMCALQYRDNLCDKNLVPAMVLQCNSWETCMNRNPAVVGRAKVGAKLIAEVLNGFVEPISWKTLTFVLAFLTFLTLLRGRHTHHSQRGHEHHDSTVLHTNTAALAQAYLLPEAYRSSRNGDEDMGSSARRQRLQGGVAAR